MKKFVNIDVLRQSELEKEQQNEINGGKIPTTAGIVPPNPFEPPLTGIAPPPPTAGIAPYPATER